MFSVSCHSYFIRQSEPSSQQQDHACKLTFMHQWFVVPFEKIQSWRWQAFQKTRVGKGKGIFPPGSHEHVPECVSIISGFFFFLPAQLFIRLFPFFSLQVFLERSYKGIKNSSLLLQVPTLRLSLLLLPHPDVRSTSSFCLWSHIVLREEETSRGSKTALSPGILLNYTK